MDAGRPVSAWVAQLVERVLGKDEVTGSIPVPGSSFLIQSGAKVKTEVNFAESLGEQLVNGNERGNSVVESLPSKQMVAGSNPVPRSAARGPTQEVGHWGDIFAQRVGF